ncbi:MAG: thioesterase family protein [Burkholderiales bacterium]
MTSSPPPRSPEEQARLVANFTDLFEREACFHEFLQLKVASVDPVRLRLDMRRDLIGHHHFGRLHGGVLATLLDGTAGATLLSAVAARHPGESTEQIMQRYSHVSTIDLRIDYLRPGLGKHFIASAEVVRLGGRIATMRMQVVNDAEVLIATGVATFIVS